MFCKEGGRGCEQGKIGWLGDGVGLWLRGVSNLLTSVRWLCMLAAAVRLVASLSLLWLDVMLPVGSRVGADSAKK